MKNVSRVLSSFLILFCSIGLWLAACKPVYEPISPPIIYSFASIPTTIVAGEQARLLSDVSSATYIAIDQGIGPLPALGLNYVSHSDIVVSPTVTTTYTLTARNSAGTSTATATITVN